MQVPARFEPSRRRPHPITGEPTTSASTDFRPDHCLIVSSPDSDGLGLQPPPIRFCFISSASAGLATPRIPLDGRRQLRWGLLCAVSASGEQGACRRIQLQFLTVGRMRFAPMAINCDRRPAANLAISPSRGCGSEKRRIQDSCPKSAMVLDWLKATQDASVMNVQARKTSACKSGLRQVNSPMLRRTIPLQCPQK